MCALYISICSYSVTTVQTGGRTELVSTTATSTDSVCSMRGDSSTLLRYIRTQITIYFRLVTQPWINNVSGAPKASKILDQRKGERSYRFINMDFTKYIYLVFSVYRLPCFPLFVSWILASTIKALQYLLPCCYLLLYFGVPALHSCLSWC